MKRVPRIQIYVAKNGEFSWRLRAANGHIVLTPNETFVSVSNAKRSVALVIALLSGQKRAQWTITR